MRRINLKIRSSFMIIFFIITSLFGFCFISKTNTYTNLNESNGLILSEPISDLILSDLPEIDYASLNETWYNHPIEMLIIAPNQSSFIDELEPLVDWKNEKGVKTILLTNFSLYPGIDNAEKIRNMIKSYYISDHIRWVLLAGDAEEDLIPIRYVYNPDVIVRGDSEYSNWDDYYKPTDFYYAELDGDWNQDGDGNWGENPDNNANGIDEITWIPDVYVGRLPADNALELANMVNKSLKYEMDPEVGVWMNSMLLAGGVSLYNPPEDEARLTEYIWQNYVLSNMNFTHLIRSTTSFTPQIPPSPNQQELLTHTNFKDAFNGDAFGEGNSVVFFAGHGDPQVYADESSSTFYTYVDASTSSNFDKPSLIYADACTTVPYDVDYSVGENSIGENLINRPNAGAIGYIGGIRVNWYLKEDTNLEKLNRGNAKLFFKEFFQEKKFQQGRALFDSKVTYMNSDYFLRGDTSMVLEWQRKNILTYNLLGDPEIDIYTDIPVSVPDYFNKDIYEGQLVSFTLKDYLNRIVPYGRVHLRSSDGKYCTVYADVDGNVKFRLPTQANETYNVTITGHNLILSTFNFTTKEDLDIPELIDVEFTPQEITVDDNSRFSFLSQDNHSGIESIFFILTKNNFQDYLFYQVRNSFNQNFKEFNIILNKLKPGDYSYAIVVRDYINITAVYYESSYGFKVEIPFTYYFVIASLVLIISIMAFSIYYIIYNLKKLKKSNREIKSDAFSSI